MRKQVQRAKKDQQKMTTTAPKFELLELCYIDCQSQQEVWKGDEVDMYCYTVC